ncbi:MAG TPA: hypothetical protein VKV74_00005 [Bryobacteraceae bacterium]|nr:hypothetical protein [Bryobacteraceae bacterium]
MPGASLEAAGPLRIWASVGNESLPPQEYTSPGEHVYEREIPASPAGLRQLRVKFELNRALGPTPRDQRELGVQVVFWSQEGGSSRALGPITLE